MTWAGGFDVYLVGIIKIPALIAENKALYPSFVSILLGLFGPAAHPIADTYGCGALSWLCD
jgi:hypothetical protein